MRIVLARFLSILGHPVLLVPAAALGLALSRNASHASIRSLAFILLSVTVAGLIFSIWNVRSGRWQHIDATQHTERRSLNLFLAAMLLMISAASWQRYPQHELAVGFLVAGLAIVAALALSPACKISLHTCFAALAAGLFWPHLLSVAAGGCIVAALMWSRLVLRRHTPVEVLWGALVGVGSAVAFHVLVG